jgi:hypothetical protein
VGVFYGSFHVRVLLASIGSALFCFFGSLRPFSLLNIYLKRSPPAFFSKFFLRCYGLFRYINFAMHLDIS